MSGSVDFPVLEDVLFADIAVDRARVGMSSRYLSAMHLLLRTCPADGLSDNSIAISRMHRGVAIAVEDNCRNGRPVYRYCLGPATLLHHHKCGGKVDRRSAGQPGVN